MSLQNTRPLRFSPAGLSDTLAEEDAFPGACSALTNLIPDPSTKNLWCPRPAAVLETNFTGFTSPTGVVVMKVVGDYVFGLVSSSRFAGKDEPFCWSMVGNVFVTVSGVTSANCPTTQPTTGDWTPPTMDTMGINLVVTHPGFDGVTNFIGWFDITNLAAPIWHAGNFALVSPLTAITIVNGGTGYTNGTYTAINVIGGSGSGATATVVVSGGAVTSVTIVNGGLGYQIGDIVNFAATIIGPGGTNFLGQVSGINGGAITVLSINNPGSGYTNNAYTNIPLTGGTGSGATANITVSSTTITVATINNGGGGYAIGQSLTVQGHGLTALANLVAGSNYTPGTFNNVPLYGGTGTGATANITVGVGTGVTACTINQPGSGYTAGNVLSAGGGGIATFSAPILDIASIGIPPDGTYVISTTSSPYYWTCDTQGGGGGPGGVGLVVTMVVTNTAITSFTVNNPGVGYAVNDVLIALSTLPAGPNAPGTAAIVSFTVLTIAGSGPLAAGSGFSVTVSTVTAYPIGPGSGLSLNVVRVTVPGGYINFTTVPSWVRQFNGRSWFGINPPTGIPSIIFSDVYALNCQNATQALSFGDDIKLIAAAPLGLSNVLGGIVQSLIIFKRFNGIIQITGDATTNNLAVNQVVGGSGTASARSVVPHPQGILYLDHDGYRMIDMSGTATDPIGLSGGGVTVPLLTPLFPTRVNAACNGSVMRVSLQNSYLPGQPWQEFWYDLTRKIWSGPHTFPSNMIDQYGSDFVVVAQSAPANLFVSAVQPEGATSFVENGVSLTWVYQTTALNDNQQMAESEVAETQIKATLPATATLSVAMLDPSTGAALNSTTYLNPNSILGLAARPIVFSSPVVYNRLAIQITGLSVAGFQIGDIYVKQRVLGYMQLYA